MRRSGPRLAVAAVAVATGLACVAPAGASTTAASARLWTARLSASLHNAAGRATVVSPNGKTVFVTGYVATTHITGYGVTAAYDAATGAKIWKADLSSGPRRDDGLESIAVSPDGSAVFAAGYAGKRRAPDQVIVAYDAATGAQLWRITGPANGGESTALAVSPDGSTLYASGAGQTAAYSTAGGAQLWADPVAGALALSADGATLFLTTDNGSGSSLTEAIDPASGAVLWQSSYDATSYFTSVAVSPDGSTVFVAGATWTKSSSWQLTAVAYDAADGARLWAASTRAYTVVSAVDGLAVTSDGSALVVAGTVVTRVHGVDLFHWHTLALDPATGATLWSRLNWGAASHTYGGARAAALALSPDGSTAYVTGYRMGASGTRQYLTTGYATATGATTLRAGYAGLHSNEADAVAVSPDGSEVAVTGTSQGSGWALMTTVAYRS